VGVQTLFWCFDTPQAARRRTAAAFAAAQAQRASLQEELVAATAALDAARQSAATEATERAIVGRELAALEAEAAQLNATVAAARENLGTRYAELQERQAVLLQQAETVTDKLTLLEDAVLRRCASTFPTRAALRRAFHIPLDLDYVTEADLE
jgi:chromosome segregation ATPase